MDSPNQTDSVLIAVPTHDRRLDVEILNTIVQLPSHYPKFIIGFDFIASSLIANARNHLCQRFMKTGFNWLYFWDSDVVIRDASFLGKLIETSNQLSADVVGGLYRVKNQKGFLVAGHLSGESPVKDVRHLKEGEVRKPQLVDVLGTGSMLIHRRVLKALEPPWFQMVEKPEGTLPEDFFFCLYAKDHGFRIAVDPRFDTFHFGSSFWQHHIDDSPDDKKTVDFRT